jgi:hypothetical protein
VWFEIPAAVKMVVTPCGLAGRYQRFGVTALEEHRQPYILPQEYIYEFCTISRINSHYFTKQH